MYISCSCTFPPQRPAAVLSAGPWRGRVHRLPGRPRVPLLHRGQPWPGGQEAQVIQVLWQVGVACSHKLSKNYHIKPPTFLKGWQQGDHQDGDAAHTGPHGAHRGDQTVRQSYWYYRGFIQELTSSKINPNPLLVTWSFSVIEFNFRLIWKTWRTRRKWNFLMRLRTCLG